MPTRILIFRTLFWLVLLMTLVADWMPHEADTLRSDNDPNIVTFSLLTVLMSFAFEGLPKPLIVIFLALFCALIELVQLIPALNRNGDVFDWYVDLGAIFLGMGLVEVVRYFGAKFARRGVQK